MQDFRLPAGCQMQHSRTKKYYFFQIFFLLNNLNITQSLFRKAFRRKNIFSKWAKKSLTNAFARCILIVEKKKNKINRRINKWILKNIGDAQTAVRLYRKKARFGSGGMKNFFYLFLKIRILKIVVITAMTAHIPRN